jgi:hypothetical protein
LRDLFLTLRDRDPVSNRHSEDVVAKEAEQARKILQVRLACCAECGIKYIMFSAAAFIDDDDDSGWLWPWNVVLGLCWCV